MAKNSLEEHADRLEELVERLDERDAGAILTTVADMLESLLIPTSSPFGERRPDAGKAPSNQRVRTVVNRLRIRTARKGKQ